MVTDIRHNDDNIRGEGTSLIQALWGNREDIERTGAQNDKTVLRWENWMAMLVYIKG